MIGVDDDGEQEKNRAEYLIASTPNFEGIESVRVELGDDHTGDPSMWVVFKLRPELQPDKAWVRRFTDYNAELTRKLIDSGLTRFPYSRFERAA